MGGLHILGTERHESRRIDNQLRGRSGRQGDPGSSRFYVSLEDEIMRIFGSDRISPLLGKLGMAEDMPIEHPLITKAIENAQTRVESHNFDIRKYLLEYDNVMNKQRETIYGMRKEIINDADMKDRVVEMVEERARRVRRRVCPGKSLPGGVGHRLPQEPGLRDLLLPHRPRPFRCKEHHQGRASRYGEEIGLVRVRGEREAVRRGDAEEHRAVHSPALPSTPTGKSTSFPSTTSRRASGSGDTARKTP